VAQAFSEGSSKKIHIGIGVLECWMAQSSLLVQCTGAVLLFLSWSRSGAAISTEQESRTMRREVTQVMLTAEGEQMKVESRPESEQLVVDSNGDVKNAADEREAACAAPDTNFINYDFPLGQEGTSTCKDDATGAKHCTMTRPGMCEFAASESAATVTSTFRLHNEWYNSHPKGCFKAKCTEATNGACMFWNSVAIAPVANDNITGTPVCWRAKYLAGTPDSPGLDDTDTTGASCKLNPDYKVVTAYQECFEVTKFLPGHVVAYNFMVGIQPARNASMHMLHPLGCFTIKNAEGASEVYFNSPNETIDSATRKPTGTPICVVAVKNGGEQASTGTAALGAGPPAASTTSAP